MNGMMRTLESIRNDRAKWFTEDRSKSACRLLRVARAPLESTVAQASIPIGLTKICQRANDVTGSRELVVGRPVPAGSLLIIWVPYRDLCSLSVRSNSSQVSVGSGGS